MKVLFFTFFPEVLTQEPTLQLNALKSLGHEVIVYDIHKDAHEEQRFKNRHFQMYSSLLDYANEINADVLYLHDYLNVPEYLLFDLKSRPNFKPKIVFTMMLREVNRSNARALAIKELLDLPQVARVAVYSMVKDFPYPEKMYVARTNFDKIVNIGEPYNENPNSMVSKKEAREHFGIGEDQFVVLWSGRWIYAKGADIFVNAVRHIDDKFMLLVHQNPEGMDLVQPTALDIEKLHSNTMIHNVHYDSGEMKYLYCASDLVVCSHRRSYEYSQSGIPGMAALAKAPIVAPDFCYFNEIVNRYKVGTLYYPEDHLELAIAINYMADFYDDIVKNAQFEKSLEGYCFFEDIPKLALKDLKI
jgi:glycosyltransferase involved in cell wall biosynthesis